MGCDLIREDPGLFEQVSVAQPIDAHRRLVDRLDRVSYLDEATGEEKDSDEPGHDLLFVHLFDLGLSRGLGAFYRRFRVDINGLALACLVVVAPIALAKGILYLP